MKRIKREAAAELRRAACLGFARFAGRVEVEAIASRPWASITFSGERHVLRLRLQGEGAGAAADAFLDGLAERQFDLRGHILADIALSSNRCDSDGTEARLELEALTVESG